VRSVRLGVEDAGWRKLIAEQPGASIFHTPMWINLLADCYGYVPFIMAVEDDSQCIQCGLPFMEVKSSLTGRRWVSLPFSDHVPILSRGTEPARRLLEHLATGVRDRRTPRLQLRGPALLDETAHQDHDQVLHLLDLPATASLVWPMLKPSVCRHIRSAGRQGVRIEREDSAAALNAFYELHVRTRHRLGVPTQPRRYFDLLGERLIRPGHGFVMLAYVGTNPVAGAVFLLHNRTITYKYGASDQASWRYRPNHLLFWTAIEWACEHAYGIFDWGKSAASDEGLRAFKSSWGATEVPLAYTTLSLASRPSHSGALQRLMVPLIRGTPPWVGRLAGELLYRHFA
jgi:CelD/BcsL family acetyltransferase involved in cellulose biosynthesis